MFSISEDNGITAISPEDKMIYSIGISTAGSAEIRMAQLDPKRRIMATTIDPRGITFAEAEIEKAGLSHQIELKIEDVSQPLPYEDNTFDYIYARLVLHYLPRAKLEKALSELHRILKSQGRLFIVVRSAECREVRENKTDFDPLTHLTTCSSNGQTYARYFHTEESIEMALKSAEFFIEYTRAYEEHLCTDFERKIPSEHVDVLIETLAFKI